MIRQSVGVRKAARPMVERPIATLWIGESADEQAAGEELAMALRWAQERLQVTTAASIADACRLEPWYPAVILLPLAWSGAIGEAELIWLSRRWPLAELVLVTGSAVDGRRRRGPALPGAVAVPWYELPGRIGQWCRQRREGAGHPLGLPATCRREDRLLASVDSARGRRGHPGLEASVAAGSRRLLDAIEMLAVAAGVSVFVSVAVGINVSVDCGVAVSAGVNVPVGADVSVGRGVSVGAGEGSARATGRAAVQAGASPGRQSINTIARYSPTSRRIDLPHF